MPKDGGTEGLFCQHQSINFSCVLHRRGDLPVWKVKERIPLRLFSTRVCEEMLQYKTTSVNMKRCALLRLSSTNMPIISYIPTPRIFSLYSSTREQKHFAVVVFVFYTPRHTAVQLPLRPGRRVGPRGPSRERKDQGREEKRRGRAETTSGTSRRNHRS